MMLWYNFGHHLLSLAALLVIVNCGGGEQRRGTDSGTSSTGGSGSSSSSSSSGGSGGSSGSSNYSNRRFHKIQHGQCTYTFILPEGDGAGGGSCREAKAGSPQYNANSLQRDAPPPEPDFPSQKIQQLEHIMENYTQWLQK
ncbi:angiopoietin-1 isoform X1, partial [Lates japonicus]